MKFPPNPHPPAGVAQYSRRPPTDSTIQNECARARVARRVTAGILCLGILAIACLWAGPAGAHVKWFCATVDVHAAPAALAAVITPRFALVGAAFIGLVFAGYLLDGAAARRWPRFASSGQRHAETEEKLVRLAVGAFFLLLWDKGAVVLWERGDAILTPELMTAAGWTGLLQFIIAVACGWRSTCLVAAVGIAILFGYGIAQFGIFHMTDYVFFPGIAAYLALSAIGTARARTLRTVLLTGGLAFGLMWTAVEKFVYPQWTLSLVEAHPDLAFGFPGSFTVVVAGFVEYTLAFFVMTGRGLVRFGAFGYALIFISAIPEFGHLDAVGHLPIVGILAVVCLHGGSPLQRLLGVIDHKPLINAIDVAGLYMLSLAAFMALYYGLHWAEYG